MNSSKANVQFSKQTDLAAELAIELSACTPENQAEAKKRFTRAVDAVAGAIERACEIPHTQTEEMRARGPQSTLANRLSRAEAATRAQASPDKGAASPELVR